MSPHKLHVNSMRCRVTVDLSARVLKLSDAYTYIILDRCVFCALLCTNIGIETTAVVGSRTLFSKQSETRSTAVRQIPKSVIFQRIRVYFCAK